MSCQEYWWAIGTSVGDSDIQNYTSTGHNVAGINSSLEGVLQHNHTYYVSVICHNGAGQSAAHNDTKGKVITRHFQFTSLGLLVFFISCKISNLDHYHFHLLGRQSEN